MNLKTSPILSAALLGVGIGLSSPLAFAHDKDPNPVKQALGKAAAAIRADADMKEVLDALGALHPKAIEKLTPAEARLQPTPSDAVASVLKTRGKSTDPALLVPGVTATDRTIPGAAGDLPATVYKPDGAGPFPLIVYYHGGGWVIADRKVYDGGARGLAHAANAVVLSVDYRQAPEHPFPAAWDDALAAYQWAIANAASLSGDPTRLALAGESAGGNLAVSTAIAARDAHLAKPKAIVAVYPVAQTESFNTPSDLENAVAQPLNRAMLPWFVDKVFREGQNKLDPRINLVKANLAGLPPVTIINARLDPLRSDGAMLEDALKKANVPVERKDYAGVTHEFFGMAAVVKKAEEAQQFAGARLKSAFEALTPANATASGGAAAPSR